MLQIYSEFQKPVQSILFKANVRASQIKFVPNCHPRTYFDESNTPGSYVVELPFHIDCNYALYVLAHECAHVFYKHLTDNIGKPIYIKEYEAEMWAIKILSDFGIKLSDTTVNEIKDNIRYSIKGQSNVPLHISEWISS
jgi:hypothetical protein